ncbi:MAG: hypothetical protein P8M36_06185, partial [Gammaproteobacteria bacterium]|nr:hypothetical protein [Gammaproteobacteria bacterium]
MTLKKLDSCCLAITGIVISFLLVACQPSEESEVSGLSSADTVSVDTSVAIPPDGITTFSTEH